MDLEMNDAKVWSETIFGQCSFGDTRLTKRLVQMGKQLSEFTGTSLVRSCDGQEDLVEGSYRFLRNDRTKAEEIAKGGYDATGRLAKKVLLLLAIEDSTSLSYSHGVKNELGDTSNKANAHKRGYIVHSTMLLDAQKEKSIGLIAQERWYRDVEEYGKKHQRSNKKYEEKESYKWEKNTHEMEKRLGDKLGDVICVCDREADIYEYIQYKLEENQRFVVRGSHNRKLLDSSDYLREELINLNSSVGPPSSSFT